MVDEYAETVSRRAAPRRASERVTARLVVVHPRAASGVVTLGEAALTFGRQAQPGAHALADGTVSRQHALIRWEGGRHVIVDLGSRNGTHVDAVPLAPDVATPLASGAVVAFGDVIGIYERGVEPAPAPDVDRAAIPGEALATRVLRQRLQQAGRDPAPVLLLGETGVGKEFCARELHRLSGRRGPFIGCNVAELSGDLVESQLFGHEKGAFTGADRAQPGLFRAADGGTLFLDEVGELPLELQPKLLRVLQEGEVRPVGQTRSVKVDVRVIAATHRDIAARVEREQFRRDLYARLALWEVAVPPLRERRADIALWLERLHAAFSARRGQRHEPLELEAAALEALLVEPWRENLRGLDRLVHRLAKDGGARPLTLDALQAILPRTAPASTSPLAQTGSGSARPAPAPAAAVVKRPAPTTRDELERQLAEHGSVRAVAKHYGRDRRQVYRWLEQFGLRDPGE